MPDNNRSPRRTLATVCSATVLVPITATGASVALPGIGSDLHAGLDAAQWVVSSFFLTFAAFMAVTGSVADRVGRRRVFLGGIGLFCAAMLGAALAPGIDVLVAARALAGVGAAAITTSGSALLADAVTGPARTRAFGLFGTAIGVGLAFGPLAAGALVTPLGWRAFFAVAALVVTPALVLARGVRESRAPDAAGPGRVPVDRAGAALFTAGLALLVLGAVEGPTLGWAHPVVVGAAIAAALLVAAFVAVERRVAHPMVDLGLLGTPRFLAVCLMPVILAFGFVALLLVLPAYLVAVDGSTATAAGVLMLLLTAPTLVVPLLVSRVSTRVGQGTVLVVSLLGVAGGAGWLTVLTPHAPVALIAGPLLLVGAGFGVSLAVLDGAAVSAVPPARAGMAAGVFNTMRLGGEAVAIAVLGALLAAGTQQRLTERFGRSGAATATAHLLQGDMPGALAAVPGLTGGVAADAYTGALHVALWTVGAIALAGAVVVGNLVRERATLVPQAPIRHHRGASGRTAA